MSNTIKMMASIKNRSENGVRALFLGSNPHSNGDVFSRSIIEREFRIFAKINRMVVMKIAVVDAISGKYIIWKLY